MQIALIFLIKFSQPIPLGNVGDQSGGLRG